MLTLLDKKFGGELSKEDVQVSHVSVAGKSKGLLLLAFVVDIGFVASSAMPMIDS